MNYGSVCSGIEAASLAWEGLGWQAKFFAEVEPFPSAVLAQRFGATAPLRPLEPSESSSDKEKKTREAWQKQIALMPKTGSIPNLGDFTKIEENDYDGKIDLLVGGCPCQSYSLAGLRKGITDPRGNLSLEFVKLCYRTDARWVVFENVPGLLSSGERGSDFANLLSLLCGWEVKPPKSGWRKSGIITNAPNSYGVAWRVLDAQYTRVSKFPRAVPLRRRRLIVIGYLGDWRSAAKVLFEQEMLGGHTPPCRTKRKEPPTSTEKCITETSSIRMRSGCAGGGKGALIGDDLSHTLATSNDQTIITIDYPKLDSSCYGVASTQSDASITKEVQPTLMARVQGDSYVCQEAIGFIKNDAGGEQQGYWHDVFPTIRSQVTPAIAIAENIIGRKVENGGNGVGATEELSYTLNCTGVHGVAYNTTARRLLPIECERLMGMPANHTQITWKGLSPEQCPDAPRYKAIGNSMAVNVMTWIGERIQQIENRIKNE